MRIWTTKNFFKKPSRTRSPRNRHAALAKLNNPRHQTSSPMLSAGESLDIRPIRVALAWPIMRKHGVMHPQNRKYITYLVVVREEPSNMHRKFGEVRSALNVWLLKYT